jgi:hypothetical protein
MMKTEYWLVALVLILAFFVGSFPVDTMEDIQSAIDAAIAQGDDAPCFVLKWGDSRKQCVQSFYQASDDSSVCDILEESYVSECLEYFSLTLDANKSLE